MVVERRRSHSLLPASPLRQVVQNNDHHEPFVNSKLYFHTTRLAQNRTKLLQEPFPNLALRCRLPFNFHLAATAGLRSQPLLQETQKAGNLHV